MNFSKHLHIEINVSLLFFESFNNFLFLVIKSRDLRTFPVRGEIVNIFHSVYHMLCSLRILFFFNSKEDFVQWGDTTMGF